jgi:hypothetical protein
MRQTLGSTQVETTAIRLRTARPAWRTGRLAADRRPTLPRVSAIVVGFMGLLYTALSRIRKEAMPGSRMDNTVNVTYDDLLK